MPRSEQGANFENFRAQARASPARPGTDFESSVFLVALFNAVTCRSVPNK
jgi:hypothetical protein